MLEQLPCNACAQSNNVTTHTPQHRHALCRAAVPHHSRAGGQPGPSIKGRVWRDVCARDGWPWTGAVAPAHAHRHSPAVITLAEEHLYIWCLGWLRQQASHNVCMRILCIRRLWSKFQRSVRHLKWRGLAHGRIRCTRVRPWVMHKAGSSVAVAIQ